MGSIAGQSILHRTRSLPRKTAMLAKSADKLSIKKSNVDWEVNSKGRKSQYAACRRDLPRACDYFRQTPPKAPL